MIRVMPMMVTINNANYILIFHSIGVFTSKIIQLSRTCLVTRNGGTVPNTTPHLSQYRTRTVHDYDTLF